VLNSFKALWNLYFWDLVKRLCIDVGNSRTKLASFSGGELIDSWAIESIEPELIRSEIDSIGWDTGIIASVSTDPKEIVQVQFEDRLLPFSFDLKLPVENHYKSASLGHDRFCSAVGAWEHFNGTNTLCIDLGSCITFDLIVNQNFVGGKISPGLEMRLAAMHAFTKRLPKLNWTASDELGTDTESSMRSGSFYGILHELNGTIDRYKASYKNLSVAITGGDAMKFAGDLKNPIFADPNLVLLGMHNILIHNEL